MMSKKYQFVHEVNGGWWLRLTSDDDIVRYIRDTNDRYDGAMCQAVHNPIEKMSLEDRIKAQLSGDRNYMLLQAGMIMAQKYNTTLYSGFEHLQTEFGMTLHKDIVKNGKRLLILLVEKHFLLNMISLYGEIIWYFLIIMYLIFESNNLTVEHIFMLMLETRNYGMEII